MPDAVASEAGQTPALDKDARNWGMICHLAGLGNFIIPMVGNIVGPLIVWKMKRDQYPFVDDQGKQALNFQITVSIALLAVIPLAIITLGIGFVLFPIIGIGSLVFTIIGGIKASNGEAYRYPFSLKLVK
jgi:uncharacterized Tic20 family protein